MLIDFNFIFPARVDALEFASLVDDDDMEVSISAYKSRRCWQTIISKVMVPTHADVTAMESLLTAKAESANGRADGWGCLHVN